MGTAEGERLAQILAQEVLIPDTGIENEFQHKLALLLANHRETQLDATLDELKARPFTELNDAEKQQLQQLLTERHQNDL